MAFDWSKDFRKSFSAHVPACRAPSSTGPWHRWSTADLWIAAEEHGVQHPRAFDFSTTYSSNCFRRPKLPALHERSRAAFGRFYAQTPQDGPANKGITGDFNPVAV